MSFDVSDNKVEGSLKGFESIRHHKELRVFRDERIRHIETFHGK